MEKYGDDTMCVLIGNIEYSVKYKSTHLSTGKKCPKCNGKLCGFRVDHLTQATNMNGVYSISLKSPLANRIKKAVNENLADAGSICNDCAAGF